MSERLSTIFGPKNLANRLSDMVLLFNVASHRSWKILLKGTTNYSREINPRKKLTSPQSQQNSSFYFLFWKLKFKNVGGSTSPQPQGKSIALKTIIFFSCDLLSLPTYNPSQGVLNNRNKGYTELKITLVPKVL